MLMETDPSPIPEVVLFPRLQAAGKYLARLASFLPTDAPDFMSDHYRGNPQPDYDPETRMQNYWQGVLDYGRDEQAL